MPMVRVSQKTLDTINALRVEFTQRVEEGKMDLPLCEQGKKGNYVTADTVIAKALAELISHRERSRKPRVKTNVYTPNAEETKRNED
jgi:hypothetical protein